MLRGGRARGQRRRRGRVRDSQPADVRRAPTRSSTPTTTSSATPSSCARCVTWSFDAVEIRGLCGSLAYLSLVGAERVSSTVCSPGIHCDCDVSFPRRCVSSSTTGVSPVIVRLRAPERWRSRRRTQPQLRARIRGIGPSGDLRPGLSSGHELARTQDAAAVQHEPWRRSSTSSARRRPTARTRPTRRRRSSACAPAPRRSRKPKWTACMSISESKAKSSELRRNGTVSSSSRE